MRQAGSRQAGREAYRKPDTETKVTQAGRQTDRETGRQAERRTESQTHRPK